MTKEEGGGCGLGSDLEPWNILWIRQNDEDTLDPQHCFKGTLSLDFYLYIYAWNTLLMKRLKSFQKHLYFHEDTVFACKARNT